MLPVTANLHYLLKWIMLPKAGCCRDF
jgi:hypothetical protein